MSVKDFSFKFTQLASYAPTMMADIRFIMSNFMSGVPYSMVKECKTTMLIKEKNLLRLMVHSQ